MSWWDALPAVCGIVALVFVPGLLASAAAGLRGVVLLGAAPSVSAAIVGLTSIVAGAVGWRWGLAPYVAGSLVTILAGGAVGWWRARAGLGWSRALGRPLARLETLGLVVAVAAAAMIATAVVRAGMVVPDALLQTWDPVHHVSGVQAIRELGDASSFGGLDSVAGPAASGLYYPTVWHALVALAPGTVPVVANASTLVIAALVWPLGLAALARAAFPGLPLVVLAAPVVGSSFLAFPTVLLSTSGQWPNSLGNALVPGAAAVVVLAARRWADTRLSGVLLCLPFLAGVVLTHGSGAFVLLLLLGPLLVFRAGSVAAEQWRRGRARLVAVTLAVAAAAVAATAVALLSFPPFVDTMNYPRAASGSVVSGVRDGLLDIPLVSQAPGNWVVLALVLAGVVAALVRREGRWLVVCWVVVVLLVGLATGPENDFRWLTGVWTKSAPRLAALVPMTASLLGALGAVSVGLLAARGWAKVVRGQAAGRALDGAAPVRSTQVVAAVVPVALLLAAWVVTDEFRQADKVERMAQAYVPDRIRYGTMVTAEEAELLRGLADAVPDDALLLGDPFNGAAFAYAVAGIDVVFPQLGTGNLSAGQQFLLDHFRDIHTDPAVCGTVLDLGITHFYADAPGWIEATDVAARAPGLYDVDTSTGFELVAQGGQASVYRVTACG